MLQNNPELKAKIDQLWNKFWSGGKKLKHLKNICKLFHDILKKPFAEANFLKKSIS